MAVSLHPARIAWIKTVGVVCAKCGRASSWVDQSEGGREIKWETKVGL